MAILPHYAHCSMTAQYYQIPLECELHSAGKAMLPRKPLGKGTFCSFAWGIGLNGSTQTRASDLAGQNWIFGDRILMVLLLKIPPVSTFDPPFFSFPPHSTRSTCLPPSCDFTVQSRHGQSTGMPCWLLTACQSSPTVPYAAIALVPSA